MLRSTIDQRTTSGAVPTPRRRPLVRSITNTSVGAARLVRSPARGCALNFVQRQHRHRHAIRTWLHRNLTVGGGCGATLAVWGYFGGVGLLWRRGATCWRRGATCWRRGGTCWRRGGTCWRRGGTCWRRGGTCWRAVSVLALALLVTALGAALLVTGFAGLLLRPRTLAGVPPIIPAIPPGGLRVSGCCDHHTSA